MYRVGLGDCFLLSVNHEGKVHHVLIDCGMFAGSRLDKDGSEKDLQLKVANHIAGETDGKLDAIVVTHEHMDHVSIFNSAKAVFQKMKVSEGRFGWVESDTDEARALRKKYEVMETHLAAALAELTRLPDTERTLYSGMHGAVASVAEFLGFQPDGTRLTEDAEEPAADAGELGAAKPVKPQPRAAMDFVKQLTPKHRFGSPGDVWDFAGLKVYVLGPPPAEKQLRILERGGATYDAALGALAIAGGAPGEARSPFGEEWRQPVQGAGKALAVDRTVVDDNMKSMLNRYLDPHDSWRRIDLQSLDSTPSLALQMDNYINNTSLALAFELPNKDVLLFPGDAQVGNWEWWFKIDGFDTKDLLKRTIFYKVGHHGSHNATLKAALDLMDNPNLVAMIPTNEAFARFSKHWNMPAPKLRSKLLQHARKRVLRNDQGLPGVKDQPMKDGDWGDLKENVIVDPLFIDYFV
jgi:beta-lactamase superfamily II metal-dependent hydrolase